MRKTQSDITTHSGEANFFSKKFRQTLAQSKKVVTFVSASIHNEALVLTALNFDFFDFFNIGKRLVCENKVFLYMKIFCIFKIKH